MIQPNEVRIGNYLQVSDGTIFKVKHILPNENAMRVDGIPITKELLVEKCGFVAVHTLESADFYLRINRSITIYFDEDTIVCCFSLSSIQLPNIKYLHQLQNLVFSLSGKELEIKF